MTSADFSKVMTAQFTYCEKLLANKSEEYADDRDRLRHFKKAAAMTETDPKAALFGMLLKHLVSLSDMCTDWKAYPIDRWSEKITDSINYLVLLRALVEEEEELVNE